MKKMWKGLILTFVLTLTLALVAPVSSFVPSNVSVVEAAAKVKLNKSKATLVKGKTLQLKISGTKKKVTWTSSNKKVATVNSKGKVTGKKAGTVTITAKVGGKKYTCKVTVQAPKISASKITLNVNKSKTLKMTGTTEKVTWSSSNKKVVTVNSKGKVTAKKAGTATITAKVGGKSYKCKVTVKTVISISKTTLTLDVGDTYTLKMSGTSKKVTWTSSKKSVASVNSKGKVTANKSGTATITAKVDGKKYTCKVTVNAEPVLSAPRTNITVAGKESVVINYTKNGSVYYEIEDTSVVSCEWSGKWADGTTLLYIYGERVGQTKVTITNSETNDTLVFNVKVTKVREDAANRILNMAAFGIDKAYKVAKYPSTLHINQIQYTQRQTTGNGDIIDRMVLRCYAQNSLGGYGYIYVVVIGCASNEHYPNAYKYDGYYYNMSSFSNDPGMGGTILDNKIAMEAYKDIILDAKEIPYD